MLDSILMPFQFAFMQQAFIISLMIAVPCALLSCFLVVRGWSLMGDAVSHAVLPGVILAYILNIPLIIGAFLRRHILRPCNGLSGRKLPGQT